MIATLGRWHTDEMLRVVNDSARAYADVLPADCYHEPYMERAELEREQERVRFFGWLQDERLAAVLGLEEVDDVTLIRHAYVQTEARRHGIGTELLAYAERLAKRPTILIGTWADARWAVAFYVKNGYELVSDREKTELLRRYWSVPERQMELSVVLRKSLKP